MDKKLLMRHFEHNCTTQETEQILNWVESDVRNKSYYIELRDLYLVSSLPTRPSNESEMDLLNQITKSKPKNKIRKISFQAVAASILAILSFSLGLFIHDIEKIDGFKNLIQLSPAPYKHTVYTEAGVKSKVTLPDGSEVILNSSSELTFPDKFANNIREVYLSGEAYFKVVKNPNSPMIVNTNKNIAIKVLGTEFNVKSYSNEKIAKTNLYTGSIEIYEKNKNNDLKLITKLLPNQSYIHQENEKDVLKKSPDNEKSDAWKNGILVFDNSPMDQVLKDLERWHGVNINVIDPKVYQYNFNAEFNSQSLIQILESIKFCTDIDYKINDKNVDIFIKKSK